MLGIFQGCYGIGGISGPLIATTILSKGLLWSRFYIITLCLAAFNLVFSAYAFWDYEPEMGRDNVNSHQQEPESTHVGVKRRLQSVKTLLSKPTLLGSCFVFAYQGAEVAISGWIISFLVQFRHGDPSKVGYVTSGFWAGITLGKSLAHSAKYIIISLTDSGRFALSFLAHKIGERLFVFIVTMGVNGIVFHHIIRS
jgi:fucose permease